LFVSRPAASFRNGPPDIVEGAFTLTGLAVETVGWIGWLDFIMNRLIYSRRAEGNAGAVESGRAFGPADFAVDNL